MLFSKSPENLIHVRSIGKYFVLPALSQWRDWANVFTVGCIILYSALSHACKVQRLITWTKDLQRSWSVLTALSICSSLLPERNLVKICCCPPLVKFCWCNILNARIILEALSRIKKRNKRNKSPSKHHPKHKNTEAQVSFVVREQAISKTSFKWTLQATKKNHEWRGGWYLTYFSCLYPLQTNGKFCFREDHLTLEYNYNII